MGHRLRAGCYPSSQHGACCRFSNKAVRLGRPNEGLRRNACILSQVEASAHKAVVAWHRSARGTLQVKVCIVMTKFAFETIPKLRRPL